ncbi:MAG: hypothetical protein D3917_13675 [Candidatus Electrothrix sp. AX5]|nr:hypothetical protein [Candidatus Electrothrix sp. AX5]
MVTHLNFIIQGMVMSTKTGDVSSKSDRNGGVAALQFFEVGKDAPSLIVQYVGADSVSVQMEKSSNSLAAGQAIISDNKINALQIMNTDKIKLRSKSNSGSTVAGQYVSIGK